ncbi:MAG: type II toxin-antitoxin system PemK/MazF family toxin [Acidobacteria bacterium]|nr:type II toxin-antitoxin system PemK/MazF family toxin [Acidobacteriota bacterium]
MKASPRRGDVFWVKLDPARGTEIRKTRPAVIISNDSCNKYGARVIVLPITSNVESWYPGEALIEIQGSPARALGDQMRSLDKSRLGSRIGTLSPGELSSVEEAILITLGFQH